VIAVGDLANERVVIEHVGDRDLSLAGWHLLDENGNEYRFPALVLHPEAQVNVFSGQGVDSSTDLYWGRSVAVWATGEQAELLDASGQQQAVYRVP
jgi:micrococcal nuclease